MRQWRYIRPLSCSRAISGEHLISETVLSILNPTALRIAGLAWQNALSAQSSIATSCGKAGGYSSRERAAWHVVPLKARFPATQISWLGHVLIYRPVVSAFGQTGH